MSQRTNGGWELIAPVIRDPLDVKALAFEGGTGLVAGERLPFDKRGMKVNEVLARARGVILRLARDENAWKEVYSGRGGIHCISTSSEGRFHALGEVVFEDGTRSQFMETTVDGGATWKPGSPPPDGAVGLSMKADGRGWAWTRRAVFSTADAGKTWQEVVQLAEDRFSAGGLAPAFDASGGVWVPDGFRVARVLGDEVEQFPSPTGRSWTPSR